MGLLFQSDTSMQELVCSSSAYAPIKRLFEILSFIPPKDAEDVHAAGDSDALVGQHRVSLKGGVK
jgi:hypothetical protein